MVKGFAEDSEKAGLIRAEGVSTGHLLTAYDGVNVTLLERDLVCLKSFENVRNDSFLLKKAINVPIHVTRHLKGFRKLQARLPRQKTRAS